MSRLKKLFSHRDVRILNVYCTAGFPTLDSTLKVMQCLQDCGVDIIELGMPYSDPLADGPVIQASATQAITQGMSIPVLLEQLKDFRKTIHIPVILMGYLNPLIQYGFEKFCSEASALGIDGLIVPDLPVYEYENEYGPIVKKYGLDFIFLVTPESPDDRIKKLDALSSGFLYAVSSSSLTGTDKSFSDIGLYLNRLKRLSLQNPILVGFGVKDKHSFDLVCSGANGAIIGSAYIKVLEGPGDVEEKTKTFINKIREGEE